VALLDGANNMFGPLSPDIRIRLLRYLDRPTAAGWEDIFSIILNARVGLGITCWQAVLAVDPSFPASAPAGGIGERVSPVKKWPRFPDAILLARAIKWAVAQQGRQEART
jgi:hypothetical protein